MHLMDEVRQQDSVAEIAQLVSARIDSVLHPTALHIFYRAKEHSELVRAATRRPTPRPAAAIAARTLPACVDGSMIQRFSASDFDGAARR